MPGWLLRVVRVSRAVWVRAGLFTLAGVVLALLAPVVGRYAPASPTLDLGQDAVATILQIIATAMLTVTTFSVTAMVSSLTGAAGTTTPRAVTLLAEDSTSQTALATFLGAFAFAIVGIVALATQYYDETARIVLFVGTLVVIVIVVVTLLRWIAHLVRFGRHADVLDRVEERACAVATQYRRQPRFGGAPTVEVPPGAVAVTAGSAGFVTHVDVGRLQRWARDGGHRVHVEALPGALIGSASVVARVEAGEPQREPDGVSHAVRAAFAVERHRTYEQDPRLGVVALGEVASRALSPATNDPGSAIDALASLHRVLESYLGEATDAQMRAAAVDHDRVHVPVVTLDQLLDDALVPIARDGAAFVEVMVWLQHVVEMLLRLAQGPDAQALRELSVDAEERAVAAVASERDAAKIRGAARDARAAVGPGS